MPSRTKKFRGLRTHGRGKKSGRGAGIIGGHGMAGYSKTKKIQMLKNDRNYFGHHGFKRPQCTVQAYSTINVSELQEQLERFVASECAEKVGDAYNVDLTKAGIDKLLGNGNITAKVNVTVEYVSETAAAKIKEAGGSIVGAEEEE